MKDETVGVNDAVAEELEQVNAEQSETAETEKVGEDSEAQASQEQGEPKHKKLGGWQRKQLKAEAERDYWREVALGNLSKPKEVAKPVQEEAEPDPDKFESTFEYLKAVRAYDRAQVLKEFEAKQAAKEQERTQKTEQQKQAEAWEQKKAAARAKYEDFDEALEAEVPVTEAISKVLLKSDKGADLAYYLGTHPEEAQQIAKLDPIDTALALGRIEATFAQKPTEQEEVKPAVTKALPPPKPVQKTQASKAVDIYDPELPYAQYVREREKQEAAKRK